MKTAKEIKDRILSLKKLEQHKDTDKGEVREIIRQLREILPYAEKIEELRKEVERIRGPVVGLTVKYMGEIWKVDRWTNSYPMDLRLVRENPNKPSLPFSIYAIWKDCEVIG